VVAGPTHFKLEYRQLLNSIMSSLEFLERNQMIVEGETSSLHKTAVLGLRCKPYTRVSVMVDRSLELWHGYMVPVNRMKYRVNFPSLKNMEFEATFKFLLSEAHPSDETELSHQFSQRRLKRFYAQLLRLDRILTEFKKKAQVPDHPKHIFAFDALYEHDGTRHIGGRYIPTYEGNRTLPSNIEEIANHQSTVVIYCQAPLRVLEHDFIHELIHHVQFSQHAALLSETQPQEDERAMLKVAKQFIPNSWIVDRFAQSLRR
jgi:hypothetical protein